MRVVTLVLPGLVHAVGAERGNLADVEALVGADALVLEVVLVAIIVTAEVDIAPVRQRADGPADGLAGCGHVIHVQFDLRVGSNDKLGNDQSDGASVAHVGDVGFGVGRLSDLVVRMELKHGTDSRWKDDETQRGIGSIK